MSPVERQHICTKASGNIGSKSALNLTLFPYTVPCLTPTPAPASTSTSTTAS